VNEKSIEELQLVGWFFDHMGLPRSLEAPINIHPSCSIKDGSSLMEIADRLHTNLKKCGDAVSSRFCLENEDKGSFNCETLHLLHCLMKDKYNFNLPLTYDNLHDKCNPSICKKNWLRLFKKTWNGVKPVMHWSEGGYNDNKRAHVQYITEAVGAPTDHTVIWELEVKGKDKAILELMKG
jgi:UV DNA damage repair endonuclease